MKIVNISTYFKTFIQVNLQHVISLNGSIESGMNSSYSLYSDNKTLANGYNNNGTLMPFLTLDNSFGAEGSIKSTAPDIIKYIQFHLSKNKYVEESFSKQCQLGDNWVGYFWRIEKNDNDVEYFRHHGAAYGSQNMIYILPEYNSVIHIITNVSGQSTYKNLTKAGEILINHLTKKE